MKKYTIATNDTRKEVTASNTLVTFVNLDLLWLYVIRIMSNGYPRMYSEYEVFTSAEGGFQINAYTLYESIYWIYEYSISLIIEININEGIIFVSEMPSTTIAALPNITDLKIFPGDKLLEIAIWAPPLDRGLVQVYVVVICQIAETLLCSPINVGRQGDITVRYHESYHYRFVIVDDRLHWPTDLQQKQPHLNRNEVCKNNRLIALIVVILTSLHCILVSAGWTGSEIAERYRIHRWSAPEDQVWWSWLHEFHSDTTHPDTSVRWHLWGYVVFHYNFIWIEELSNLRLKYESFVSILHTSRDAVLILTSIIAQLLRNFQIKEVLHRSMWNSKTSVSFWCMRLCVCLRCLAKLRFAWCISGQKQKIGCWCFLVWNKCRPLRGSTLSTLYLRGATSPFDWFQGVTQHM